MNAKFDLEKSALASLQNGQKEESKKVIENLKERDLRLEKQHRELKTQIAELRDTVNGWSNHTLF